MPHLYKMTFKGGTYWCLREVDRVDGKVRSRWQKYLGTAETIVAKIQAADRAGKPASNQPKNSGGPPSRE
jgi:hypothetical protein